MKEEVISILKKINNKKYFIIFFIYFILLIGVVIAENPEIFGHNPEEFNGFNWTGAIGELTYSTTPLAGGHSTSELENVVWFDENNDGIKETGAILKDQSTAIQKFYIEFTLSSCYGVATWPRNCENRFYNFFMQSQILNKDTYSKLLINAIKFNGQPGEVLKGGLMINSTNHTYSGLLTFKTTIIASGLTQNYYYYIVYSNVSINSEGIHFDLQRNFCGFDGTGDFSRDDAKYFVFNPLDPSQVNACKQEGVPNCQNQILNTYPAGCAGFECKNCPYYATQKTAVFANDQMGWI